MYQFPSFLEEEENGPSRRSALEVQMDIIKTILSGKTKPTRIMYSTNTSWKSMKDHLQFLIDKGLVEEVQVSKSDKRTRYVYNVTDAGLQVFTTYNEVASILDV